jgi:hypothetical protein
MEEFVPEIRKIRYASLMFTPFKAADNSSLINNSSVLDPRSTTKNFSKNCYYEENGNMIRDVFPGSRLQIFFYPGSRMQGSKKLRIPDPHPQYC